MTSKADRIKELTEILNRASKAYYMQDTEIMSNYEYDALYDELVQLEKETGITLSNSPTIHVGVNCRRKNMNTRCCHWTRQRMFRLCRIGWEIRWAFFPGRWTA